MADPIFSHMGAEKDGERGIEAGLGIGVGLGVGVGLRIGTG